MIINIRGTSGSGKSTIIRSVMGMFPVITPTRIEGRRQPTGYWLGDQGDSRRVYLLGHYESACGGCDTLPSYDVIYDMVRAAAGIGHVLFEGLLVSEEVKRTKELENLLVVQLTTPIEVCLEGIRERRRARGDERELNPANTTNRVKTVERACQLLREHGIAVETLDRESAAIRVMELLDA